jgi:hypothetical protein
VTILDHSKQSRTGWTAGAARAARFLAGCPGGETTLSLTDTRVLLLETSGMLMACGYLYDIDAKPIGAGVHRITLKPRD